MEEMDSKYTCVICGKGFENNRAQIRHASYCRRRARNPPKPRKRSCLSCTKAKTQCDAESPTCSRCLSRHVTCVYQLPRYPKQHGEEVRSAVISLDTVPLSNSQDSSSGLQWPNTHSEGNHHFDPSPDDFNGTNDLFESSITVGDLSSVPGISQNEATMDYQSSALISNRRPQTHFPHANYGDIDFTNFEFLPSLGVEPVIRAPRAFWPKKVRYRQLSLNRKFVICSLTEFPNMMLPGKGMPPFIHPQSMIQESKHVARRMFPGPLSTCAGIVAMWSVKTKDNSVFIWKAIRQEQERLSKEYYAYSDLDTVGALQAICIYFILRVSEEDSSATDFDVPLIGTMIKIASKTNGFTTKYTSQSNGHQPTWEVWLLVESLRRTILTLFIVTFLFDITEETNHLPCSDGVANLAKILLPCSKDLWTAPTRVDWEREYQAQSNLQNQSNHRPPTFGNLLQHDAENSPFGNALDKWLGQVDNFGALVMAAASLSEDT